MQEEKKNKTLYFFLFHTINSSQFDSWKQMLEKSQTFTAAK